MLDALNTLSNLKFKTNHWVKYYTPFYRWEKLRLKDIKKLTKMTGEEIKPWFF